MLLECQVTIQTKLDIDFQFMSGNQSEINITRMRVQMSKQRVSRTKLFIQQYFFNVRLKMRKQAISIFGVEHFKM